MCRAARLHPRAPPRPRSARRGPRPARSSRCRRRETRRSPGVARANPRTTDASARAGRIARAAARAGGRNHPPARLASTDGPLRHRLQLLRLWPREPQVAWALSGLRGVELVRGGGSARPARLCTGIGEFDRVLGGGLVPGSLVLIGGSPGIGKSTLTSGALGNLAGAGHKVLYVSGEESAAQVKLRAERLGGHALSVPIVAETDLEAVLATLETEKPDVCVVDSVQVLYDPALTGAPGSVGQVREVAGRIMRVAKERGIATLLVGHVTKEGSLAGPRVLEHLVDCVLSFEGE